MIGKVFLTGGARSGKSHAAEQWAAQAPSVTYVATGPPADPSDAEWTQRVHEHRERRPDHWTTVETSQVTEVLLGAQAGEVLLVDCLTLWLTARLDALDAWSAPFDVEQLGHDVDALVSAVRSCRADLLVVSNEVGSGIVPDTPGVRLFRDWLGTVNARVSAECDRSFLLVAGRALALQPLPGGA